MARTEPQTTDAADAAFDRRTPPDSEAGAWRLVLAVTVPFWAYLALMRVFVFSLMTAGTPGIIIAPPHVRLLQHLLMLPLLLLFYRWALAIGWPERGRLKALAQHASMAVLFAIVARPLLLALVASDLDDWTLLEELVDSVYGRRLSVDLWVSTASDFLLSYVLGLAILLGVHNYRELKHHKLRAANLQAAWVHSRLQALRMQLNPHFLFNSLNTAVALVASRPKAAEQMLVRLADLLRRTLHDGQSDFTTAAREADYIRTYLEVQRMRFPDRLSFDVEVGPDAAHAVVPSLLLQPLAENAVVHSMAADVDRVHIDVRVQRKADALELTVRNSASACAQPGSKPGIGLSNTRERLATLYGADQRLELIHEPDGAVLTRVRIPFIASTVPEAA